MKKLYAYSDEAIFKRGKEEIVGTGILFSKKPITTQIIKDALQKLENDEDFDSKKDSRTIKRGYFHASDDSKNAHSYLCREIVKNIEGNFIYSYINPRLSKSRNKDLEKFNRLTLQLASSKLLQDFYEVDFIIEQRSRFNNNHTSKFISSFYHGVEVMAYTLPSIINIFPKMNIEVKGKTNSGLQVVDFILWAMNRSMMLSNEDIWKDRLNLKMKENYKIEDESEFGGNFYINKDILEYNLDSLINYPFLVPKDIPKVDGNVIHYYSYIEELVELFFKKGFPNHAKHLYPKAEKSFNMINSAEHFNAEKLKHICSTFIQIFDTIPIYRKLENKKEEIWLDILYSKRLAGLIIRNDGLYNNRTRNSILRWKFEQKKHSD